MTLLERLKLGRERVAKGWTQEVYARDEMGKHCSRVSRRAVCWCASGAVDADDDAIIALRSSLDLPVYEGLEDWNDSPDRTQADVIRAFDETIERIERESAK